MPGVASKETGDAATDPTTILANRARELSALVLPASTCLKYRQMFLDVAALGNQNTSGFAQAIAGGRKLAEEAGCLAPAVSTSVAAEVSNETLRTVAKTLTDPADAYFRDYVFGPMGRSITDGRRYASRRSDEIRDTPECRRYKDAVIAQGEQFPKIVPALSTSISKIIGSAREVGC